MTEMKTSFDEHKELEDKLQRAIKQVDILRRRNIALKNQILALLEEIGCLEDALILECDIIKL